MLFDMRSATGRMRVADGRGFVQRNSARLPKSVQAAAQCGRDRVNRFADRFNEHRGLRGGKNIEQNVEEN
jgi:hypothetical protein